MPTSEAAPRGTRLAAAVAAAIAATIAAVSISAASRGVAGSRGTGDPAAGAYGPIERVTGIYLQRAIELATVDTRLVRLTRMTAFRRCGRRGLMAEDLNDHLTQVTGREVPGFGFVAATINVIEGCAPACPDPGARHLSPAGPER